MRTPSHSEGHQALPGGPASNAKHLSWEDDCRRSDDYFNNFLIPKDEVLEGALRRLGEAGMPNVSVSWAQGKQLTIQARAIKAKTALEIGTLAGFSTICIARGLVEGGHIDTIEIDPRHAEIAKKNFEAAGFASTISIHVGKAADALSTFPLPSQSRTYDLIFIDADKPSNLTYFKHAVRLSHPGTVIILDNVIRNGKVADPSEEGSTVQGVRDVLVWLKERREKGEEPAIEATAIQTVGEKWWDGYLMAIVT